MEYRNLGTVDTDRLDTDRFTPLTGNTFLAITTDGRKTVRLAETVDRTVENIFIRYFQICPLFRKSTLVFA